MLLLILGDIGSGKSAYAARWAMSLGREAIRLSCPAFPGLRAEKPYIAGPEMSGFTWHEQPADSSLAATLNRINRESNIFRADRRVLVVDSLSGWLRDYLLRARQAGCDPGGPEDWAASPLQEVTAALLSFQGKRIVVSEEASAGLAEDPWERRYAWELAAAIRRLAEESHAVYRLTAGFAAELKGHRVNRGRTKDENLYPNRG